MRIFIVTLVLVHSPGANQSDLKQGIGEKTRVTIDI